MGVLLEFPRHHNHPTVVGACGRVDDTHVLQLLADLPDDATRDAALVRYWSLEDYQLVTVHRNREWFLETLLPRLRDTWAQLQTFVADDEAYARGVEARKGRRKRKGV